ncbi:ATP-binding protein [Duganella levis]|uniref:AAA family ATPase n=1 Tax=Duganella levis TaxID=2692169 RepID=A0ABW9VZ28_9BURK|nr:ATP-binding protein [Duganella levis]MYN26949.1 AAA family ATPase [Duganella levis]
MNTQLKLYDQNILIDRMPQLLNREQTMDRLTYLPPMPKNVEAIPRHERLHHMLVLQELHIASDTELQLSDAIDLIIRGNYRTLDPRLPETWAHISEETDSVRRPRPPAMSASMTGPAGTGKTTSIQHKLCSFEQTIMHEKFPGSSRPFKQLVYLSVEVPASGKAKDLAARLMYEMDRVCGEDRFSSVLSREAGTSTGRQLLERWRRAAKSSFLGLLHLDEIQNLFKIPTLATRRSKKASDDEIPNLAIVEDETLRALLGFMNGGIPLLISGTLDGFSALNSRLSTSQRIMFAGRHQLNPYRTIQDEFYQTLLETLLNYQYVSRRLEYSEALATLILELTGGIVRMIIALWFLAHRVAFDRGSGDELRVEDFKYAADIYIAPLKSGLDAARSNDPARMRNFSDLRATENFFWTPN